jgi:hypothetical protein
MPSSTNNQKKNLNKLGKWFCGRLPGKLRTSAAAPKQKQKTKAVTYYFLELRFIFYYFISFLFFLVFFFLRIWAFRSNATRGVQKHRKKCVFFSSGFFLPSLGTFFLIFLSGFWAFRVSRFVGLEFKNAIKKYAELFPQPRKRHFQVLTCATPPPPPPRHAPLPPPPPPLDCVWALVRLTGVRRARLGARHKAADPRPPLLCLRAPWAYSCERAHPLAPQYSRCASK